MRARQADCAWYLCQLGMPSIVLPILCLAACRFMPDNLSGVLAGYPNSPPTTATAAADHSRAGCGQDSAGEDDDEGSEGAADLDELEASDDCDGDEPEAAQAGVIRRNGSVSINPVLMVVPQLLDMGYQVRLCLLNAAYYGAPEKRWVRGHCGPQPVQ